jgi:hypothetical protein
LVKNLPIPKNFEYIFIKYIQTKKIYFKNNFIKNTLKTEIIMILILNWIIKNIKSTIEKYKKKYYNIQWKIKQIKNKKVLKKNKIYTFLKNITWYKKCHINFVFYTTIKRNVFNFFFFKKLKNFFKKRGLQFFKKQILIKKQKIKSKIYFFLQKSYFKKYFNFKLLYKKCILKFNKLKNKNLIFYC